MLRFAVLAILASVRAYIDELNLPGLKVHQNSSEAFFAEHSGAELAEKIELVALRSDVHNTFTYTFGKRIEGK